MSIKKRTAAFLLSAAALAGCAGVFAVGGTTGDPLVTLSYLNRTYIPGVVAQAGERVDAATQKTYQSVLNGQSAAPEGGQTGQSETSGGLLNRRVKRGDAVTLNTGSSAVLLAGGGVASYAKGAVVDVTAGQELASGKPLTANHRYLAAENTSAILSITSDTAVISVEGGGTVLPSAETDYNALADALSALGMFRGTGTGYGSGYDLERPPTRIEGVVMFLRLTGEEKAALAATGECPFADVPDWCKGYVTYASGKGYVKGIGNNQAGKPLFGTGNQMSAGEYVTLILRVLGYTDSGKEADFTWQTALGKAKEFGVLTDGEHRALTQKPFLRAQVAYLSYFALDAGRKSGGTLLDYLAALGTMNAATVGTVRAGVRVTRM